MKTDGQEFLSYAPEIVTNRSFWFHNTIKTNALTKDCCKPLTFKERVICYVSKYCPTFMDWYWQLSHPNLPHNKLTK